MMQALFKYPMPIIVKIIKTLWNKKLFYHLSEG